MVIHLVTNASVLDSPATYQRLVYQIHGLGRLLPFVEWTLIFIPILFHALLGIAIIRGGLSNLGHYPHASNLRYTLQRATGMIAFAFIMWHVFHLHGWFHFDAWLSHVAKPPWAAQFRPFNATSSLTVAMQGVVVPTLYAVGMLSCVFHLANGMWTMGITWGVWVSPAAQKRANGVCIVAGIALAAISAAAWLGAVQVNVEEAKNVESKMRQARRASGEIDEEDLEHREANESAVEY